MRLPIVALLILAGLASALPLGDEPIGEPDADAIADLDAHAFAQAFDEAGRLVWETGLVAPDIAYDRTYDVASSEDAQKKDCTPEHADKGVCDVDGDGCMDKHACDGADGGSGAGAAGGSGSGPGGSGAATPGQPGTDCASDAHVVKPWAWQAPYAPYASFAPDVFVAAAEAWNGSTKDVIFGGVTPGAPVKAGNFDGISQIDQAVLPQPGVLAITTTWYRVSTGEALEADTTFNLAFLWSTTDDPLPLHHDLQNTATHEMGHVFGLGHPAAIEENRCLTMYPAAAAGDTHQRTLGDGDLLGLRAHHGP